MEHQVEQRDVVIKVKYGDTLRRIGAYVHGHTMDHNMSRLRAKIVGLFKFNHDAELLLTYIDEDGDTVTLDDDDELRDAVISQRLNPLRINVQFKSADSSDARSETSSPAKAPQSETPPTLDEHVKSIQDPLLGLISNLVSIVQKSVPSSPAYSSDPKSDKSSHAKAPQNGTHPIVDGEPKSIQDPFMDVIHNLVNNVQKSVPSSQAYIQKVDELMKSEPIRSVMANVAQDLKKTTSLSPVLDQIMEQVSNLALSKAGGTSGPTDESSIGPGGASAHQMASSEQIQETTELPSNGASSVCAAPKQNTSCDMTQVAGDTITSVGPNGNIRRDTTSSLYPFDDLLASILTANKSSEHDQEVGDSILNGKSAAPTAQGFQPGNQTPVDLENLWNSARYCPVYVNVPADTMVRDNSKMQSPVEAHASFPSQTGFSSHIEVPVSRGTGSPPTDVFPKLGQGTVSHSYRRSYANNENIPRTFHRGVQCDGCGMHPIVGPRFKSNVKDDYDLCNICFAQMGNETEYTRIDHASRRAPRLLKPGILKDFHNHHSKCRFPSVNVLRASGARPSRAKLESRFVQDVTVLDGTVMPPSTRFTKIWRLHNNGTLAWPFGTQLVWVGGDQFGDRVSSTLEIPANGFPVDKELDIAVDFTAPSRPGRYVSYWRMATLSGQQFGQRVWVLIQVDYSGPNSAAGSNVQPAFNLNLPPDSSSQNLIIDVNAEPLDSGLPEPSVTTTTEEPVKPVAESVTVGEPVQVVGGLLDAGNVEHHQSTPAAAVPPVASYPLINLQEMPPMVDEFPVTESAYTADSNPVEQTLLKELEDMGFKEINLNKEILRLNEYNLEQSVDDLCGFAEWDPLLCELQEMGFNNREMNKKALIKNGGSIKRAVLDLIAGQISE